jgi:transcriptional regulator with XRE-family HTH domain
MNNHENTNHTFTVLYVGIGLDATVPDQQQITTAPPEPEPPSPGRPLKFGEKLKELRQASGLTQAGLALASGRGLGAIRDYEQGNRAPLLATAFQLVKALDVSVEVFPDCDDVQAEEKPPPRKKKTAAARTSTRKSKRTQGTET